MADQALRILMAGWSNLTAMQRPVQWAVQAGYDVCVAGSADLYPENTPPNYQHFQVGTPWPRNFSSIAGEEQVRRVQGKWSTLKLVEIGRLFRPDIVHAHGVTEVADWCLQARLEPLVVSAWGALNKVLTGEMAWQDMPEHVRRVFPAAAAIIVESPALVAACTTLPQPPRRVELIPLGVDTRRFDLANTRGHTRPWRRSLKISDDACVLLSPRGWDEVYGQHSILEAYALARPAFRRPTVLAFTKLKRNSSRITGPYFERVAHRAVELEVTEHLRWIPSLRYEMMPTLYALADVVVSFPSQDAFPSTLVEAAACSRPVVSADLPSYRGTFFEECFALVEPQNVDALAAALVEVVNDPTGQDERVAERGEWWSSSTTKALSGRDCSPCTKNSPRSHMAMPAVSVIIPTYQRAGFVSQAIDSVLAQTYTGYEIIVVDDGSTDNTPEVLAGYGDRIRVIYQANRGAAAARNTGIRAARGRYIAFLDDDDLWFAHKLEMQIPILDANPEAALVFTDLVGFDENGIRETTYAASYPPRLEGGAPALFRYNFIGGATVCARRRCLEEIGLFNEISNAEDYDLWLQMIEHWPFRYVDEPLYYYRQWPGQKQRNAGPMIESVVWLKEKAYDRNPAIRQLPWATLDAVYFAGYLSLARRYLSAGRRRDARSVLQRYRARRGVTRPHLKSWAASWLPQPLFHALSRFRQRSAALTNPRD